MALNGPNGAHGADGADGADGAHGSDGVNGVNGPYGPVGAAHRRTRGAIRVYLGYAPGCGVTTAMLEEARRRRSRGADVVVATVDCRGREGVTALLEGLELVGDGATLDTGAVLARHPEVACVDDLAAVDPSGESRFAAARRLADAGITVVGTVQLSHLRTNLAPAGTAPAGTSPAAHQPASPPRPPPCPPAAPRTRPPPWLSLTRSSWWTLHRPNLPTGCAGARSSRPPRSAARSRPITVLSRSARCANRPSPSWLT